jgi:transglutaminase-like putative cysteine protease
MTYLFRVALRRLGWHSALALLLLWLGLASVLLEVADAVRGLDVWLLLSTLTVALLCGWGLANTHLRPARALAILLLLGLAVLVLSLSVLWDRVVAVLAAFTELGLFAQRSADPAPLWHAVQELNVALQVVLVRLWEWGGARLAGRYASDPVAGMLAWGFGIWCVAAWSAWRVFRRRQVAAALGPAAALLTATLYNSQRYPSALLVLLITGLLLAALSAHMGREESWTKARIDFSEDIRFDLVLVVVPLSAAIVLASALTSSFSLQDFVMMARSWLPHQAATLVLSAPGASGSMQAVPASAFENIRLAGLPRRHLIGSGPELSQQIVMRVRVSHAAGIDEPRFYWRSVTYDRYTGRGWASGEVDTIAYRAESALYETMPPFHFSLDQDVSLVGDAGGLLYASGIIQSVGSDAQFAYRSDTDFFGGLIDARAYHVLSFQPLASDAALRAAGTDYPEWVRERYLALPDDVPPRVLTLANNLTAIEPTAYDRARAIERYLRSLPYTLQLPEPPPNRDVVDYFLFDLQKGYCDYYASAMVVLARAAGLPARLVVGYAAGTFDAAQARYVVTAADAHSWVEVYFEGIGWIEFEPTAGRPALEHSASAPIQVSAAPVAIVEPIVLNLQEIAAGMLGVIGGSLLLVALIGMTTVGLSDWRMQRMLPSAAVSVVYGQLLSHAMSIGLEPRAGDTPHEIVYRLECRLTRLAGTSQSINLSGTSGQLRFLADVYARAIYSSTGIDEFARREAVATWQRIRPTIWRARWRQLEARFKRDPGKQS